MDTFIPDVIRESAPSHATKLDLVSATRRSQCLAWADAIQKRGELFAALDDLRRALKGMQAVGASKDFLWDCAAGAIDQARNIQGRNDRELDAQGLTEFDPVDLSELEQFLEEVR